MSNEWEFAESDDALFDNPNGNTKEMHHIFAEQLEKFKKDHPEYVNCYTRMETKPVSYDDPIITSGVTIQHRQRLDIRDFFHDKKMFASICYTIIHDSVHRIHERMGDIVDSLRKPVADCKIKVYSYTTPLLSPGKPEEECKMKVLVDYELSEGTIAISPDVHAFILKNQNQYTNMLLTDFWYRQ